MASCKLVLVEDDCKAVESLSRSWILGLSGSKDHVMGSAHFDNFFYRIPTRGLW